MSFAQDHLAWQQRILQETNANATTTSKNGHFVSYIPDKRGRLSNLKGCFNGTVTRPSFCRN